MHYCLQDPQDQVVGFVLDVDHLSHEIYRILDWADEHLGSYSVDQTDGRVHVRADEIKNKSNLHAEPLSVGDRTPANDSHDEDGNGGQVEPVGM